MKQAPAERWAALAQSKTSEQEPQTAFLYALYRDLFHYAAYHAAATAHNLRDIDLALRWGYGWEEGLFDLWQMMGWQNVRQNIEDDRGGGQTMSDAPLPDWCCDPQRVSVYQDDRVWSPEQGDAIVPYSHPLQSRQLHAVELMSTHSGKPGRTLFENEALRLWCEDDDMGIVSLKTKLHTLNHAAISGLAQAIHEAERCCQGLIIWSPQAPFCCLLYTSPSPRDRQKSRMPSSA